MRFIPTRVGYTRQKVCFFQVKRGSSPLAWGIPPVYPVSNPHNCGSSPLAWGIRPSIAEGQPPPVGSSPLAWGIPFRTIFQALRLRFIPTRVGYTTQLATSMVGERFIPTRVGYTILCVISFPAITVHPHSRGVYIFCCCSVVGFTGSSPLACGITITPAAA